MTTSTSPAPTRSTAPEPIGAFRVDIGQGTSPILPTREVEPDGAVWWRATSSGAHAIRIELALRADEHITGFGERFTQVDKRGHRIDGWVGVSRLGASAHGKGFDGGYKPAPLWHSSAGYAAVLDSNRRWVVDIGLAEPDRIVVTVPGDRADLFIVPGYPLATLPAITARWGRAPIPAPWVFGVWRACRGGHDAVVSQAELMRAAGLACSAIWIDAHWHPATNSGYPASGSYPRGEYSDIVGTVRELHERGFRVLSYLNPFLYPNTPAHDHAIAHGFAIRSQDGGIARVTTIHPTDGDVFGIVARSGIHSSEDVALVDFTNPEARAWWKRMLAEILEHQGFDGWMEDFGEEVPVDAVLHDHTTGAESHNRYPVLYHEAAAEQIARSKPDGASFSRSGYLGSVQHCAVLWPGDQTRDWSRDSGLGAVPAAGITAGLMGASAWGPDIGGVMDFAGLGDARGGGSHDEELYIRWCQLGAMSPVMRDHLGFFEPGAVDGWSSAATVDAWRRWGDWHVRLFPYFYALARHAHETGVPIIRGLMFEFPDDPRSWTTTDTYLLGDALLCAPVLTKGATARAIELPEGDWWDTFTPDRYEGGVAVEVPAGLDRLPVLQRGGTILPLLAEPVATLDDPRFATGDYDLELRLAGRPDGLAERRLPDGTHMAWDGSMLRIEGPVRRYRIADSSGVVLTEVAGTHINATTPSR